MNFQKEFNKVNKRRGTFQDAVEWMERKAEKLNQLKVLEELLYNIGQRRSLERDREYFYRFNK